MSDWQHDFLESCCEVIDGVTLGDGAFSPGPALWVGRREVAHFDDDRALDLRLTRARIREARPTLREDPRVELRPNQSDWLEISIASEKDLDWARVMVADAVDANLPSAPPGPPPDGEDLARRRRFH